MARQVLNLAGFLIPETQFQELSAEALAQRSLAEVV